MSQFVVSAMYKFTKLPEFQTLQAPLLAMMKKAGITGTLLLAEEGINGTVSGSRQAIDALYAWLKSQPEFEGIEAKESFHQMRPFNRTKVKLKKEIVTLGVEGISPTKKVGQYVKPADWNALISRDDVVVVDTRNDYEYEIGTFKDAINPETETFREFPEYVAKNLQDKSKKVAMFCTGGIRCEKSTSFMLEQGFDEVYHLEGGILKYLEEVPEQESLWQGECFVFDERVAVNHQLEKGQYEQCFACRYPITSEDMQSEHFVKGISCPRCIDKMSDEQRERFSERQKQSDLAKARGETHIGQDVHEVIQTRRDAKVAYKEAQRQTS
jgi:UPF0176 protein